MQTQADTHCNATIAPPSLGEFLKKTRLSQCGASGRPLTISDIKRRSDLSLPVLSKLEAGKIRDPKFSTIVQVCKGYGLPFEALALFVEDIAAARQVGPQAEH
ncbi:helix-turn-helix domain-containing protein [Noviherbaspirillum soli]|uniref:helix-turn-helix domain-containing protein n=1 Tax=Noviherbaspirillum soli TaxID=1064518 RepID=UPI00188DC550|nr:helix-turn-helix transcriptional regulator [Noviherbaspirillum soli]